jgi:hypothetical protein
MLADSLHAKVVRVAAASTPEPNAA